MKTKDPRSNPTTTSLSLPANSAAISRARSSIRAAMDFALMSWSMA
jgi:hypothetical protein